MIRLAYPRSYLLVAALCFAVPSTAPAKPASSSIKEALAACFVRQAKLVPFSGVVLADNGSESFSRTAGFFDADQRVPMPLDARFRLASVQKVMTRTAIGQLVEDGRVGLDAPVGTYVRSLPTDIAAVTIDQLLQHRSGVNSMTLIGPESRDTMRNAKTARDLLPVIVAKPLAFRPGEREEYSNGGYYLLGVVIEEVSGQNYADYLAEHIFTPLAMTSTNLVPDERTAMRFSRMAPGQPPMVQPAAIVSSRERAGTPAGDGVSTAGDLLKLGRALAGDRFISKAVKERIFPKKGDVWRVGQSGGTRGVNADFAAFPVSGWVVTVLSNYDPPAGELMGEVLRGVVSGKGCTPLSPSDRQSPFNLILRPPPSQT